MYNTTTVIGRLGNDAEMRYTPGGTPVTDASVATSRTWTDKTGEKQEKTTWFRVTFWGKLAEVAGKYLHKGDLVMVEGEIEASAFTDREGNPRASLELTARTLKMLSTKRDAGDSDGGEATTDTAGF